MPVLRHDVTIAASPARVWAILTDVERLAPADPQVDTVERLEPGPLVVGSRTRLRQPRLPEAVWTVTELDEGTFLHLAVAVTRHDDRRPGTCVRRGEGEPAGLGSRSPEGRCRGSAG